MRVRPLVVHVRDQELGYVTSKLLASFSDIIHTLQITKYLGRPRP
jgi:hypothetical protein